MYYKKLIIKFFLCYDCHKKTKSYRIVEWGNYDRSEDKNPQYRCK